VSLVASQDDGLLGNSGFEPLATRVVVYSEPLFIHVTVEAAFTVMLRFTSTFEAKPPPLMVTFPSFAPVVAVLGGVTVKLVAAKVPLTLLDVGVTE
jgi:hypothetical protein